MSLFFISLKKKKEREKLCYFNKKKGDMLYTSIYTYTVVDDGNVKLLFDQNTSNREDKQKKILISIHRFNLIIRYVRRIIQWSKSHCSRSK